MSNIKSLIAQMALLAIASEHTSEICNRINTNKKLKVVLDEAELQKNKGLTEFNYNGNIVFALNKKNADRKAKNKGWI